MQFYLVRHAPIKGISINGKKYGAHLLVVVFGGLSLYFVDMILSPKYPNLLDFLILTEMRKSKSNH